MVHDKFVCRVPQGSYWMEMDKQLAISGISPLLSLTSALPTVGQLPSSVKENREKCHDSSHHRKSTTKSTHLYRKVGKSLQKK